MNLTAEKIGQIPEVYRDFMMVLSPVVETRGAALRISGIPWGMIVGQLSTKYSYDHQHLRTVADNLRSQGFVDEDRFGFFAPTAKGEELIRALAGTEEVNKETVPPLPAL